jgi:para-aminobenzoate synthetase
MKEVGSIDTRAAGTRVLLIDNYSSFTFNLYQFLAEITGVLPRVVPNDSVETLELADFDAVVLSPGPGTPQLPRDFGICKAMFSQSQLPVLGVCLGHQGLGVSEGTSLGRAPEPYHGRASTVHHQGGLLFEGIPKKFQAIRYHSLVLQEPLPDTLECIARTNDGQIMALRHRTLPYWGVQFHPESIETEYGHQLLANFCALSPHSDRRANLDRPLASPARPAKTQWRSVTHALPRAADAEEIFSTLFASSKESFWLDGNATEGHSYMGDSAGPRSYRIRYSQATKCAEYSGARSESVACSSIFDHLEDVLAGNEVMDAPEGFAFVGGLVGYFGYELRAELGSPTGQQSALPDAHWIWADRFLAYDHRDKTATLVMLLPANASDDEAKGWFGQVEDRLGELAKLPALPERGEAVVPRLRESRDAYEAKIADCIENIRKGESYELCLTTQLSLETQIDPFELFRLMRRCNPAPYAAYLACDDFCISSASPERFLKIDADRWVESKPIKGTARRDEDPATDRALAESLQRSEKDLAENLMIVDLVRNDLGKCCEVGSVVVTELAAIESYATVHQLVSTIGGRLRSELSAMQCVRDTFPGGSMTGAPKRRSMEILDRLEGGPRGPYAGSIGFLGCDGAVDLSIVIRSVVIEDQLVSIGVGGAITALSAIPQEYEEVLLKAKAQLQALGALSQRD